MQRNAQTPMRFRAITAKLPSAALICALVLPALVIPTGLAAQTTHTRHTTAKKPKPAPAKKSDLNGTIQALLAAPEVARDHWGISVIALDGTPVYRLNDAQYFTPASNTKLFTTAAALALLGPDFVSKTYVLQQGTIDALGHISGAIRLVGTGDPGISARIYPDPVKAILPAPIPTPVKPEVAAPPVTPLHILDDLANELARQGIHSADTLIVDSTFFPYERFGTGWSWDDLQWDDGAPVAALTVNDNTIALNVEPGAQAGAPLAASWNPPVNYYTLERDPSSTTTAPGTPQQLGVDRQPGSLAVRLFGSMPAGAKPAHLGLAIENPASFAATAFLGALSDHGIKISSILTRVEPSTDTQPFGDALRQPLELHPLPADQNSLPYELISGAKILAAHTSPTLIQDVTVINKISQNLHAELLLRQLGKSQFAASDKNAGSFASGARVVRQFLINAGVDPNDFYFYDGSGMSGNNIVTPRAITRLLTYAAQQPWGAQFRDTLPIAGVDGTLANRFTKSPLKGRLFAKTGTLSEVNALSGYLVAKSGRTVVISILINTHRPSTGDSPDPGRATMDKIIEAIAAAN